MQGHVQLPHPGQIARRRIVKYVATRYALHSRRRVFDDMAPLLNDDLINRIVEFFTRRSVLSDSDTPTTAPDAPDLVTRLFCECEHRHLVGDEKAIEDTASSLEARSVFFHQRVLIFAKPSLNTMNMHVWLDAIFGLDVIMIHDQTMFAEWLYRHIASVDFLILERDSFEDESSFSRFLVKAREIADGLPLIVMGRNFRSDDFEPSWYDPWDISLRIPISQISCWMSVKKAADITLNGRI